jgi:AraC-like DNA-binding protein
MNTQKPHLDEDLSLPELAQLIDATPHQLSQLLNQHLGLTFYDFINQQRIAAVKRCLDSPSFDNQTVLDVGLSCGFGSKATFNAMFKRLEGMTPSQYRRARPQRADAAATAER